MGDGKGHQVTERLHRAMALAWEWHGWDARKKSPVPIMGHLLAVCALVQHHGGDEDQAIAALLHDSLEDKADQIPAEVIQREFGYRVLEIVRASTDTPPDYQGGEKPPWRVRKKAYLKRARSEDPERLLVTVADKVDNLRAILADAPRLGHRFWCRFNASKEDQLWYYRKALKAYRKAGFRGPLLKEMRRLVRKLDRVVNA